MNWYKNIKIASVTFALDGTYDMAKPMHALDVCQDLVEYIWYDLKIGETTGIMLNDIEPDISETHHDDPFGRINIYMNSKITEETIRNIIDQYNQHKTGYIKLKFLGIDKSRIRNIDTARLIIEENETIHIEEIPTLNVANENAYAIIRMLYNEGIPIASSADLIGQIEVGALEIAIDNIEQNDYMMQAYTQKPTEEINEQSGGYYDQGRSYEQLKGYLEALREMINYAKMHDLPNKIINYG